MSEYLLSDYKPPLPMWKLQGLRQKRILREHLKSQGPSGLKRTQVSEMLVMWRVITPMLTFLQKEWTHPSLLLLPICNSQDIPRSSVEAADLSHEHPFDVPPLPLAFRVAGILWAWPNLTCPKTGEPVHRRSDRLDVLEHFCITTDVRCVV